MKKNEKRSGEKVEKSRNRKEMEPGGGDQQDPERRFLLVQLQLLTERLDSCQLRCEDLRNQNRVLRCQNRELEDEKKDMAAYLKGCVLEKEAEVEVLTERLTERLTDQDRDHLQNQDLHTWMDSLVSENKSLVEQLGALEESRVQKEKLLSDMASMKEQLANQREEHRHHLHSLEMKALMEKRSLERELENHVEAMAAEVQQQVEQKVPESTRQALQENVEVKAHLGLLMEQVGVLTEENEALREQRGRLGVEAGVLERVLGETSRTSCVRKKVVEQLTTKCRRLQAEQDDWKRRAEQLQGHNRDLQAQTEALRREQASLADRRRADRAEFSRLEAELQEERKRRSRMKSMMQDAAVTLHRALMEAPPGPDSDPVLRWKRLVQRLLGVLLRPSCTTTDPCDPTGTGGPSDPDRGPAPSCSGTRRQLPVDPVSKHTQTGSGSSSSTTQKKQE